MFEGQWKYIRQTCQMLTNDIEYKRVLKNKYRLCEGYQN